MGDIKQFPNLQAELREQMAHGLRVMADSIEQGLNDYDGLVVVGYWRSTHEVDPLPFAPSEPELNWIGAQLQNWALTEHYESLEDDD